MLWARKPVVFDAVQIIRVGIDEHPFKAFTETPEWLLEAVAKGEISAVSTQQQRVGPEPYWTFRLIDTNNTTQPLDYIAKLVVGDGVTEFGPELGEIVILRNNFLNRYHERTTMPTTPDEAPIGHPEPPHETDLGADSTPAPEMAEVAEDQLQAEEVATDE